MTCIDLNTHPEYNIYDSRLDEKCQSFETYRRPDQLRTRGRKASFPGVVCVTPMPPTKILSQLKYSTKKGSTNHALNVISAVAHVLLTTDRTRTARPIAELTVVSSWVVTLDMRLSTLRPIVTHYGED
jgi:hypothetical protein